MKENKNLQYLTYGILGAALVAGAVWGGIDIYKDYKRTTSQAESALEAKDYSTAREILWRVEQETKNGSLIVPLSSRMESKLKAMLKNEPN